MPFKKILVPFDGSPGAEKALRVAAQLAKSPGTQMAVLNVAETISFPGAPTEAAFLERGMRELQELEMRKSAVLLKKLKAKALLASARGHPVDVIIKYAKKGKFDVIVMGSRGRSGISQMFLGSVSEGVIHHAHCAVLVVRKD